MPTTWSRTTPATPTTSGDNRQPGRRTAKSASMDAECRVCAQWATTTIVRLVAQIMKKCQWRVGEKKLEWPRGVGLGEHPELGHAMWAVVYRCRRLLPCSYLNKQMLIASIRLDSLSSIVSNGSRGAFLGFFPVRFMARNIDNNNFIGRQRRSISGSRSRSRSRSESRSNSRWEMEDGRWEMGDGDRRWRLQLICDWCWPLSKGIYIYISWPPFTLPSNCPRWFIVI